MALAILLDLGRDPDPVLAEALIPEPAAEALACAFLHGLPGFEEVLQDRALIQPLVMSATRLVNSSPLSVTMTSGLSCVQKFL